MTMDQRQRLIRDLKVSSSMLNTAADLLSLLSDSPEEESAKIILDLAQRAQDLIDSTELLEKHQS